MSDSDSLSEWLEAVCQIEFGSRGDVVRRYLEKHHDAVLRTEQSPTEVIRRDLLERFRQGVNEYVRATVWNFLERERSDRKLSQHALAEMAGTSQSTYSKIRTGKASFESIVMFLRALDLPLGAFPTPSALEQTIEGLLRSVTFVKTQVFQERLPRGALSREDAEWLLHMDACSLWTDALQRQDNRIGQVIAKCLTASISIRQGRQVPERGFSELAELWQNWCGAWEICMVAISSILQRRPNREFDVQ